MKLINVCEIDQCEAKQNKTLLSHIYLTIVQKFVVKRKNIGTRGFAANIKNPIMCQDKGSSSHSNDPFQVLTKVEEVPVSRPHTPEIVCLDDLMILKPSCFSIAINILSRLLDQNH